MDNIGKLLEFFDMIEKEEDLTEFVRYEVYRAPDAPTEKGTLIGSTPILEQAEAAVIHAAEHGLIYFIKGITANGAEWYLM